MPSESAPHIKNNGSSAFRISGRQLLVGCVCLLAACGTELASRQLVRLSDSRANVLAIEPPGWSVPAAQLNTFSSLVEIPGWVWCVLSAGAITAFVSRVGRHWPLPIVLILAWAMTWTWNPAQWFPAVLVMCATAAIWSDQSIRMRMSIATIAIVCSILLTQEFGFVTLLIVALTGERLGPRHPQQILIWAGSVLGVLTICSVIWPGFGATALRPVNWFGVDYLQMLLPAMQPVFELGTLSATSVAAISVSGILIGLMIWTRQISWLLLLVPLGWLCAHYLWLTVLALACSILPAASRQRSLPREFSFSTSVVVAICASMMISPVFNYSWLLTGLPTVARVDPSAWRSRGPVLLMNLDDSQAWQFRRLQRQYELLLDDRWESSGRRYGEYAGLCRDIREVRAGSYLRSDLSWGGYKQLLSAWPATLVVTPSDRLLDLRRISLSPNWKVMGIDAERVIFGHADEPTNQRQMQAAYAYLTQLEWPRGNVEQLPENTIVADNWRDSLRVSRVLSAIRFPYAALRFLPADQPQLGRPQRIWAHLEIAHRVQRHTGQPALLDQIRITAWLKQSLMDDFWTTDELLRAAASLEHLGLFQQALEMGEQLATSRELTARQLDTVAELQRRCEQQLQRLSQATQANVEPIDQLQYLLAAGQLERAATVIGQLEPSLQTYYRFFLEAAEKSSTELFFELQTVLQNSALPPAIAAEGYFVLGCLGLEVGDTRATVSALQTSLQLAPQAACDPLRKMYLLQSGAGPQS